jgi:hypothetical protein
VNKPKSRFFGHSTEIVVNGPDQIKVESTIDLNNPSWVSAWRNSAPGVGRDRGRTLLPRAARWLEKREYVRFISGRKDEDSHVGQGIFQAAAQALERQNITGSDADELNQLRAWFSENLEKSTSFGLDTLRLGISWFKTDSTGPISRTREMVQILEGNGIYVNLLGA